MTAFFVVQLPGESIIFDNEYLREEIRSDVNQQPMPLVNRYRDISTELEQWRPSAEAWQKHRFWQGLKRGIVVIASIASVIAMAALGGAMFCMAAEVFGVVTAEVMWISIGTGVASVVMAAVMARLLAKVLPPSRRRVLLEYERLNSEQQQAIEQLTTMQQRYSQQRNQLRERNQIDSQIVVDIGSLDRESLPLSHLERMRQLVAARRTVNEELAGKFDRLVTYLRE